MEVYVGVGVDVLAVVGVGVDWPVTIVVVPGVLLVVLLEDTEVVAMVVLVVLVGGFDAVDVGVAVDGVVEDTVLVVDGGWAVVVLAVVLGIHSGRLGMQQTLI